MKKKKLLITTDSFLPRIDGVARFLMEVIPSLREKFIITVIAPDFPGKKVHIEGVEIIYVPLSKWKVADYQFAKYKPRFIRPHIRDADIIFNQCLGSIGIASIRMAKKEKKGVVSFIHSIDWELVEKSIGGMPLAQWIVKFIAKRIYKKCTMLIFPSQQTQLKYEEKKIMKPSRIVTLGVDTAKFMPPYSKAVAKKKIGLQPKELIIGFCGRIGREKDLSTLKKAFENIDEKFNTKLLIVGQGLEHDLRGKNIHLVGKQDNVVPYLQAMDVYVLPSLTETTSLSTLEAMSCGLAVVCTPVGALKNYIHHEENGYLFPRGNVKQLGEYLTVLLRHPSLRNKLGRAARKTVSEQFHWKSTVEGIIEVLEEIA